MIIKKIYNNMDNLKFDNVDVHYGFTFSFHPYSWKNMIMTIQIIPL
jgi:hypothetical protein